MKRPTIVSILPSSLVLALALALSCGPEGGGAAPAARFEGGGLRVEVTPQPGSPRTGANRFHVVVQDAAGRPVDDAEVGVQLRMDMAGMPPMGGRTKATPMGDGAYEAPVQVDMAGTWQIAVEARRGADALARAEGSFTTGMPGLQLAGAAAPAPPPGTEPAASAHAPGHEHAHGPEAGAAPPPAAARDADVRIDEARRRQIGIRSAPVELGPFEQVVRATGRVTVDESALVDVSLRVRGWVTSLRANAVGVAVARGEVLLTVYSPELYAAQQEYLLALRSQKGARDSTAGDRVDGLVRAARTRLRLFDVSDADIAALARDGRPLEAVPVRSPVAGFVVEKDVVQGAAVEAGARLLRLAPSDRMWIEAQIPEDEQRLVAVGQRASVSFSAEPGRAREATVTFVSPTLDPGTRTARVRLELPNEGGALRPDAFANVELRVPRGERLLVPASAVVYAGPRRVVFVDLGDGRLRPTEVVLGSGDGERVEVVSGLEAGQRVVVSGNFLVAAESRLKSALESW
jgi:Cu(I)/Ag(I) efflux system membrane fusion protein